MYSHACLLLCLLFLLIWGLFCLLMCLFVIEGQELCMKNYRNSLNDAVFFQKGFAIASLQVCGYTRDTDRVRSLQGWI